MTKKDSVCINCGAAVTFEERDGELLPSVRCAFCGAVNQRAQAEQRERRAEERRQDLATAGRRRFLAFVGGGLALIAALGTATAVQQAGQPVATAWAELERARAQVGNVRQRQAEVLARFEGLPPTPEHEAEVTGAANRVRVERRRYDQAAAAYNATTGSALAKVAARLHGLPPAAPASDAVNW